MRFSEEYFFGKYTVSIVRSVIISFVGSMQVLAGHKTGCQAAIHAMHTILDYAVLLIDASNVLNSIYREVHLNYIFFICPAIATYVRNCHYFIPSVSLSERTTQGDSTSLPIYATTTIPLVLIVSLTPDNISKMDAYADYFTAGGKIKNLNLWGKTLCDFGLKRANRDLLPINKFIKMQ